MRQQIIVGAMGAIVATLVIAIGTTVLSQVWHSEIARYIRNWFESSEKIPPGTVIAMDHRDGCPNGWEDFEPGFGRFIVGVGKLQDKEYTLSYVKGNPIYDRGGMPRQQVTANHLPRHTHKLTDEGHTHIALAATGKDQGWPRTGHNRFRTTDRYTGPNTENKPSEESPRVNRTAIEEETTGIKIHEEGKKEPSAINTIPPYVALFWCKKK